MAGCETLVRGTAAGAGATMIFQFLISYHHTANTEIVEVISDCLAKVLEDNLNEFDNEVVEWMVIPSSERVGDYHRVLFDFSLDLPDEIASPRIVMDEFAEALNADPVVHLVKFDDPLVRADLARWADEIYALEMKLRRVLTLVYLHAYQDGDPYELLREERVQPMNKDLPKSKHMKERAENQFFHLTFSQYIGLNRRPEFKLPDLVDLVRNKSTYDDLHEELTRSPVEDEDDAVFLAGLKERMDAIEAMRNCCAHNRRPSKKVEQNYLNACPLLDEMLDKHLANWEWQEPVEEMRWDREARQAVENALVSAYWNEDERTITLFDADDNRIRQTVASREELEQFLCEAASMAFYANAPREDGRFLVDCDDEDIVWAALEQYEQQLEEFFGGDA